MVKVRFRVQKYLGFDPWRHSEPFIWETYRTLTYDVVQIWLISQVVTSLWKKSAPYYLALNSTVGLLCWRVTRLNNSIVEVIFSYVHLLLLIYDISPSITLSLLSSSLLKYITEQTGPSLSLHLDLIAWVKRFFYNLSGERRAFYIIFEWRPVYHSHDTYVARWCFVRAR